MAARKRKPVDDADEAPVAVAQPPARLILRCHRERGEVVDIETTMAELRAGLDVPTYLTRVQIV